MAIPRKILGKTGVEVTALGLGGVCWNLAESDHQAVEVVQRAIDRGITYIDTASAYKDSERRLGLALKERNRNGLFIASKCLKRSGDELKREIEDSFRHLQIDVIDLMQIHAIDEEHSLDQVLRPDGALRVIEQYRDAGQIRFVGLTGHTSPAYFVRMVGEYDFDTILNPVGPCTCVWNDFVDTSMAAARARGMGLIGMKVVSYGQVPDEDRPLHIRHAMRVTDVAIIGMDTVEQVEDNVRVAKNYAPLTAQEEQGVMERARELVPKVQNELWWLPEQRMAS